jgi:hypothetical protein
MTGLGYVRIRSWHIVETFTRVPGMVVTRCGYRVMTIGQAMSPGGVGAQRVHSTADTLPAGEKSCESCLRLARRDEDRA